MIQETEAAHKRLGNDLSEAESRLEQLTGERSQSFSKLAEIYLPELGEEANRLRGQLPEMRDKIEAILWEKRREIQDVEEGLAVNRRSREELEARHQETTSKLEEKAEEREALREKVEAELETIAEHAALVLETQQAKERLLQSKRRMEAAVQERDEKIPAYESNVLFGYLLRRDFGTPEYRGRSLFARLDGWVARKVDFREQRNNYRLLQEVPDVMRKEVDKSEQYLKEKGEELLALEKGVEDRLGLTKVMEEGESLYEERVDLMSRIEQLDQLFSELVTKQKELDDRRGSYYERALREYEEFLQSQSIEKLKSLARSTETRSDDGLALRIETLEQSIAKQGDEVMALVKERSEKGERLKELLELESRFRQEDYDASNSFFGEGFDVQKLLTALVVGAYGLEKVMGVIRQFQRFRRVDHARGASTLADILIAVAQASMSGGRGPGRRRRGGGFRGFGGGGGSGGFGGGGSRTTGGFG
jgi:chromosome segregation ATPase